MLKRLSSRVISRLHVDKAISSRFFSSIEPFAYEKRRFDNAYLDIRQEGGSTQMSVATFDDKLRVSMDDWKSNGIRAIWAYTTTNEAQFIPSLISAGFTFHYAKPNSFLLLSKWIGNPPTSNEMGRSKNENENESKLPPAPYIQMGCAGIVINESSKEVLIIKERHSPVSIIKWKLPGGLVDDGESIEKAVTREVFEETGIECHFHSVIGFRHQNGFKFAGLKDVPVADLYVLCRLTPLKTSDLVIKPCQSEILDAKWCGLDEFIRDTDTWPINEMAAKVIQNAMGVDSKETDVNGSLPCDIKPMALPSVSVPGSTYHLYFNADSIKSLE